MDQKKKKEHGIVLTGMPVSPGAVVARAYVQDNPGLQWQEPDQARFDPGREGEMRDAFYRAVFQAREELACLARGAGSGCEVQGEIFAAQREILEDEELLSRIGQAILEERLEPESAIRRVFAAYEALFCKMTDPLIAARVADLQDVKRRLLCICQGGEGQRILPLKEEVILVARDLLPSDMACLDRAHIKGIITEMGGTNSHTAILARSLQIPAISGIQGATRRIPQGILAALDAVAGEVILEPDEVQQARYGKIQEQFLARRREEARYLSRPGSTRDGKVMGMGINIGSGEVSVPGEQYDFVGLLRTEFLYMEHTAPPTEEEQYEVYRKVLRQAKGKTVTLRTLDIGGDKALPCLALPREENSFLGSRGLRLCLARPDIFQTQLRAALRASALGDLELLFPMVGSLEEIFQARAWVRKAMEGLAAEGFSYNPHIRMGIMIEVPSIALVADLAAEEVDFASIGTNDLAQYVSAADRMNPGMGPYYQGYSPAMLRLLEKIFSAFAARHKPVCVCGEMAGDPQGSVLLAGLGARKLSMDPASLAGVKAALAKVSLEEAKNLAGRCLCLRTQEEILGELVGHESF